MRALVRYYQPPALVDFPVHNVPLMMATEGGLFVAAATVAFGVAAAVWAARSGRRTVLAFACYLPFLMLDTPISLPQGTAIIGLWMGVFLQVGQQERRRAINAEAPSEPLAHPTPGLLEGV
jgi:hypothetical protein